MWQVYTDGSASPNPGPGGAGAVILYNNDPIVELIHAGGKTTNNRMELYALIMAIPNTPEDVPVTIWTDSQYVKNGLNTWIHSWIKKGWKKADGKPVLNKDLWQQLLQLRKERPQLKIEWVKGHSTSKWNQRADELANEGTARSKAQ